MNYALDALWWRLTDPNVRDLAALLTAPPLWHTGCELEIRKLLGETGFRYLLALDANPIPLHQHLQQEVPFGHRLGFYAESLLAFWFAHAPHTQLYARNLPVQDENGLTLGAFDFIAAVNGKSYHIELTCKYYGSFCGKPENMIGLNPKDRLADKVEKLRRQLAWSQLPEGKQALAKIGLGHLNTAAVSIVRGIGFSAERQIKRELLNPYGWHGLYIEDWAQYIPAEGQRYYPLLPMQVISPARVSETYAAEADILPEIRFGQIAVLEKRPDGYWHETARIMKSRPSETI